MILEKIEDNEHFEYKGDVHVFGSIGKNATIIIKDGGLIVDGNVGDSTEIKLEQQSSNITISSGSFFIGNCNVSSVCVGNSSNSLNIKGNMGDGVIVNSHNAEFKVEGSIGSNCKLITHNGSISTGNVGEGVKLKSHNGDIYCGNVAKNSSLLSHNGDVKAEDMGEYSSAITHNGDVRVKSAPKSANLDTKNGKIYENGIKRQKEKSYKQSTTVFSGYGVSINNGTVFSSSNGRIIVNGKDITSIVNATNFSKEEDSQPIRFKKK